MTVTIISHSKAETSFESYLDAFDDDFVLSGFGAFSDEPDADFMGGVSAITQTPVAADQAFAVRGAFSYDPIAHVLGGSASKVEFGHGGAQAADGALSFEKLDFSVTFDPEISEADGAPDMLTDMMWNDDGKGGNTSTLRDVIAADDILFLGRGGADEFTGGRRGDALLGGGGRDLLKGKGGADEIKGGGGADRLLGNGGRDSIDGGGGADELAGGGGADALSGGGGRDRISGGGGADEIHGGRGRDFLEGGRGADSFLFDGGRFGRDTIFDFQVGRDSLVFSSAAASGFEALMDGAAQVGDDLVIRTHMGVVKLLDIDADDLGASDVLFV